MVAIVAIAETATNTSGKNRRNTDKFNEEQATPPQKHAPSCSKLFIRSPILICNISEGKLNKAITQNTHTDTDSIIIYSRL